MGRKGKGHTDEPGHVTAGTVQVSEGLIPR